MSVYTFGIDHAKRKTMCQAKDKCFFPEHIIPNKSLRIMKEYELTNVESPYKKKDYYHIDCYAETIRHMREGTEHLSSDNLKQAQGWNELDEDEQNRVEKFFKDFESNPSTRFADELKGGGEEEEEEKEEKKEGKKRKPSTKGKEKEAKSPAKKKKKEETKLEHLTEPVGEHIYLENKEPGHNKFYEVWIQGTNVVTKYGAIPSYTTTKAHIKDKNDEEAAKKEMNKIVKEKEKKGYQKAEAPSA